MLLVSLQGQGMRDFLAGKLEPGIFITDTLQVDLQPDSNTADILSAIRVHDIRPSGPRILDIQETEVFKVIPVDQVVSLPRPLAALFQERFSQDSLSGAGDLHLVHLTLWMDNKPFLAKGRRLNAYTVFYDSAGLPVSDWCWEISLKQERKEAETHYLGRLVKAWTTAQSHAIQEGDFNTELYPHLYRRQFLAWNDLIWFPDGFALNAHLTLDFPADQEKHYVRGAPGVYYRQGKHHETIAIGGMDQHWFWRLDERFLLKVNVSGRFGFNNFDRQHYGHLDPWNILYVGVTSLSAVEYRPVYHKGMFAGAGVFQSFHALPDAIRPYEIGLSLTVGLLLP